jgi:16S rRNA (cytidine1402-2'-O)-methyltransferase
LGDLSQRASALLGAVDRVAAEDTRRARVLLAHLGLRRKAVVRLDAHATEQGIAAVLDQLERGRSVALVSDAGMPSVSDPGARLVQAAAARNLGVVVVPGPSALSAAVALSGLVEGPFSFLGFLPRRGRKRTEVVERVVRTAEPVVLFEAPGRTRATLSELAEAMPDRPAVVCRELTKLHEEARRGPLSELCTVASWRGEITIVLGATRPAAPSRNSAASGSLEAEILERLRSGASAKTVVAELAPTSGIPRRELYARVQALRDQPGRGRQRREPVKGG